MSPATQSSNKAFLVTTHSLEETQKLGQTIGEYIESGVVIALTGDLGSGKTSFVQGLARGLDVPEHFYITSPTYTLINEYPGRFRLFHIDLYRIGNVEELEDLGFEEIFDGNSVVAVEWAGMLSEDFLSEYLALEFNIIDDASREIRLTAKGYGIEKLIKKLTRVKLTNS